MPRVTLGDRVRVDWAPHVPVSWHNPTAEALPLTGVVRAVSPAGFHLALTEPAAAGTTAPRSTSRRRAR